MGVLEVDFCDGVGFCKKCHKLFIGGKFKYCPHCSGELLSIYKIKEFDGIPIKEK